MLLAAVLFLHPVTANAEVIFSEDFSGGSADINGTAPDVTTTGATWVASSVFNQDGSVDSNPGSMTLAFTPANGLVYALDATLSGVGGGNGWFALGFVDGQSTATSSSNRFINSDTTGIAWMLFRGTSDSSSNNQTHINGTSDPAVWLVLAQLNVAVDMRIILDTTAGTGNWTATWYAKMTTDSNYSVVRDSTLLQNQNITSVGMALGNNTVYGTIESFSLSDNINVTNPTVDAGSDWVTWTGEAVTLDNAAVNNNDPDAGGLTLLWTSDNPGGVSVGFSSTDVADPTITIIKDAAASNPTTVTLTLSVTQAGKDPVTDTMEIDVYDNACDAGKALGSVTLDPADFNGDCVTNIEDLVTLAAAWLVDYQADIPAVK